MIAWVTGRPQSLQLIQIHKEWVQTSTLGPSGGCPGTASMWAVHMGNWPTAVPKQPFAWQPAHNRPKHPLERSKKDYYSLLLLLLAILWPAGSIHGAVQGMQMPASVPTQSIPFRATLALPLLALVWSHPKRNICMSSYFIVWSILIACYFLNQHTFNIGLLVWILSLSALCVLWRIPSLHSVSFWL